VGFEYEKGCDGPKSSDGKSVDVSFLSGRLFEAANILRGPVDAADFKTYIFPLLFFKRISDVYDEERAVALEESDGDAEFARFPENHRFQVPEGCHWKDVRAKSANIGHALRKAMRCIEQANPDTLHGIFGDAQWTNKDRLSDALLKDLIEHFSSLNLGNEHCKADILGQAYEYLIKKFADLTNKKAGEFYTPRSVVALMLRILAPKAGETISTARKISISNAATPCACPPFIRATASPSSTALSPILPSPWKSGGTMSGSTTPTAATLPDCRRPNPATSPGSST